MDMRCWHEMLTWNVDMRCWLKFKSTSNVDLSVFHSSSIVLGNNKLKSRVLPRLHANCTSKVTFREVLTMLAVFDCIFIRFDCTLVLPQIVCFCHVCCWYCAFSYFSCCSTVSTTFGLPQLSAYWKVIQFFLPEILITRKTLPAGLSQSVNVNQWTLGLFLTQTWIHPHLFPYLLPFIQVACIVRKAFARMLFCFRSRWMGPSGRQCQLQWAKVWHQHKY